VWSVNLSMLAPIAARPLHAFSVLAGKAPAAAPAPSPAPAASAASAVTTGAAEPSLPPGRADSPLKSGRTGARGAPAPAASRTTAPDHRSASPPPKPSFQLPRTPPHEPAAVHGAGGGGGSDVLSFMAAMGPDAGRDGWLAAVAASSVTGGGGGGDGAGLDDSPLSPGLRQVGRGGDGKLGDTAESLHAKAALSHTDRKTMDGDGDGVEVAAHVASDGKEDARYHAVDPPTPAPPAAEVVSARRTPPAPAAAVVAGEVGARSSTAPALVPNAGEKATAILEAVARAQEAAALATAAMAAAKASSTPPVSTASSPAVSAASAPAAAPTPATAPAPAPVPVRRQPTPPADAATDPVAPSPAPPPSTAAARATPAGRPAKRDAPMRTALAAGELIPASRSEPLGLDLASFLPANNARGFGASRVLPTALASTFTQSGKQLAAADGAARIVAAGHSGVLRTLSFRLQEVRAAADLWGAGNVSGCLAVLLLALASDATIPVAFVRAFRLDSGALNLDSAAVMWRLAAAMFATGSEE